MAHPAVNLSFGTLTLRSKHFQRSKLTFSKHPALNSISVVPKDWESLRQLPSRRVGCCLVDAHDRVQYACIASSVENKDISTAKLEPSNLCHRWRLDCEVRRLAKTGKIHDTVVAVVHVWGKAAIGCLIRYCRHLDCRIPRDIDPTQDVEILRFQMLVAPLDHAVDDRDFPEGVAQARTTVIAEDQRPWLWIYRSWLVDRCPVAMIDVLCQLQLILEREEPSQPNAPVGDYLRHCPILRPVVQIERP